MKNQNEAFEPTTKQNHTREILLIVGGALLLILVICFVASGSVATIGLAEVMAQLHSI